MDAVYEPSSDAKKLKTSSSDAPGVIVAWSQEELKTSSVKLMPVINKSLVPLFVTVAV